MDRASSVQDAAEEALGRIITIPDPFATNPKSRGRCTWRVTRSTPTPSGSPCRVQPAHVAEELSSIDRCWLPRTTGWLNGDPVREEETPLDLTGLFFVVGGMLALVVLCWLLSLLAHATRSTCRQLSTQTISRVVQVAWIESCRTPTVAGNRQVAFADRPGAIVPRTAAISVTGDARIAELRSGSESIQSQLFGN